ncbi:hypothetical protein KSS87_009205 [Heliosperma pusillum]|nr:hypothetical protein KSS87_009205 [Heliosperma pusillum]
MEIYKLNLIITTKRVDIEDPFGVMNHVYMYRRENER